MENPSKFSLFKLPLIATEHVLRMLNPFELIDLSLTSIRSRKLVSYFYKSNIHEKFTVSLRISEMEIPYIVLRNSRINYKLLLTSDKSKEGFEKIYDMGEYYNLYKYSEDVIEGLMRCYEHLKKVFECQIGTLFIEIRFVENRSIVDWLKRQQEEIDCVCISNFENVGDIKYFLSNIKVTEQLLMDQYNFHGIDSQSDLPEDLDYLFIYSSNFSTIEGLLKLKSRGINLSKSSLTNRELNMFLKSWMSCESHLHLEQFEVGISGREAMTEILDLPHEKKPDPDLVSNVRNLWQKRFNYKGDVNDVYEVKRSDGKVANVCLASEFNKNWKMFLIIH